jgi:hypothetical protein
MLWWIQAQSSEGLNLRRSAEGHPDESWQRRVTEALRAPSTTLSWATLRTRAASSCVGCSCRNQGLRRPADEERHGPASVRQREGCNALWANFGEADERMGPTSVRHGPGSLRSLTRCCSLRRKVSRLIRSGPAAPPADLRRTRLAETASSTSSHSTWSVSAVLSAVSHSIRPTAMFFPRAAERGRLPRPKWPWQLPELRAGRVPPMAHSCVAATVMLT